MKAKFNYIPFWIVVGIVAAVFVGYIIGTSSKKYTGDTPTQKKMAQVIDLIGTEYVDVIDTDSLLETVFPNLVGGLDPHSSYIPASDLREFNEGMEGAFGGVGISFNMINDSVNVIEVVGGGPSERSGLMAGDRIVTVNGEPVVGKGYSAEKIRSMLRGAIGSHVQVEVKRSSSPKLLPFDIERGEIPINSIDSYYIIEPGIGYLHVNQFSRTTYDEYINALGLLALEGAESFIIDLRGNPGGFLEMAILMANEFLPKGAPIVFTRQRNNKENRAVMSDGNGSFPNAQVVVLLDEYSASSSEVFSGALQDNDRGLIVGRRSFGKGLIQKQTMLPDSSAIQITVGRYYTPSGRSIQKDYSNQENYRNDLYSRFTHGEAFSADSIRQDTTNVHLTLHGRTVYGGGGIMPDVFVPSDTSKITGYYLNVVNAGLIQKFAFNYVDTHRELLGEAHTVDELLKLLPADDVLLRQFVNFASAAGVPSRWYYINISAPLIVNQLKAIIARDVLGNGSSYEILNRDDNTVKAAVESIRKGEAKPPVSIQGERQ